MTTELVSNAWVKISKKCFRQDSYPCDGLKIRYIACAGLFLAEENEAEVVEYAETLLESLDVDCDGVFLEPAGKHYSLIII